MNIRTILSAKGQVVIPKDVRDALGMRPGQPLDVSLSGDAIVLRAASDKTGRSFEEIEAQIREIASAYKGPPITIDQMNQTISESWRDAALRSDCHSDRADEGG